MRISEKFNKDIVFLSKCKTNKNIVLTPDGLDLKLAQSSPRLLNYLMRFIQIITCGMFTRQIDKLTSLMLNRAEELSKCEVTEKEKLVLKHAFRNLSKIVRKNVGKDAKKIDEVLLSIDKLKILKAEKIIEKKTQVIEDQQYNKDSIDENTEIEKLIIEDQQYEKDLRGENSDEKKLLYYTLFEPIIINSQDLQKSIANYDPLQSSKVQQIELLFNVFKEIELKKNQEIYQDFLQKACGFSEDVWKKALKLEPYSYYHKENAFKLQLFFSLIEKCEDKKHKENLFDLATRDHLHKSERDTRPGCFDKNRVCQKDIDLITILSKSQRQLLGLDKFEPEIELFTAIKHRTLDQPEKRQEMIDLLKTIEQNKNNIFLIFIDSIGPNWLEHWTPISDRIDHLSYFISWLESIEPQPQMLKKSIKKIFQITSGVNKNFHVHYLTLLKKLSYNVLENFCLKSIIYGIDYIKKRYNIKFEAFFIINAIELLKIQDRKKVISQNFKNLTKIEGKNLFFTIEYAYFLLKYVDESTKLKQILKPLTLIHEQTTLNDLGLFSLIFNYLEKYPWKLFLVLDDQTYNHEKLREWLNNQTKYPICANLLKMAHENPPQTLQLEAINSKLQKCFEKVEEKQFQEARSIFSELDPAIRNLFYSQDPTINCTEIRDITEIQVLVALLEPDAQLKLCQAIEEGIKGNLFDDEEIKRIINIAINIKENLIDAKEKELVDLFLGYELSIKRKDFWLNKCPQEGRFSDIRFKYKDEVFHAHRAFLNIDPKLKPYFSQDFLKENANKEIELLGEDGAKKFSAIKHFYSFQLRDLVKPREGLESLFNNEEAYPDFKFICKSEILYVHKAVLATTLPFFQPFFANGMQETRKNELEIDQDKFEELKAVLYYVYSGEIPEFANEDAKRAFEEGLDYYSKQ